MASVKAVHQRELRDDIKAQIILGNTYHLYLRPGLDILHKAGGLHKFNGWERPILTDSGGFQVFSLSDRRKLTEEGAHFRSHIDGSKHLFTPENVVDTQRIIGSDIMMALDECTPGRCRLRLRQEVAGPYPPLARPGGGNTSARPRGSMAIGRHSSPLCRGASTATCVPRRPSMWPTWGADGNAIGGLAVGEPTEKMYEMIEVVNDILPQDKPRYLMGVGTPANILEGIERGVDMFDCVMPTRNGRNGMLFTRNGIMNMRNKKWADDFSPIDPEGTSFVDTCYSKAYLRHLFISEEILAMQIASIHNLAFMYGSPRRPVARFWPAHSSRGRTRWCAG